MKLVPKLTAALVIGLCGIFALNGYVRHDRDIALFLRDVRRDHRVLANALANALEAVWAASGQDDTLALVEGINERYAAVEIRWIWLDAPPGHRNAPALEPDALAPLWSNRDVAIVVPARQDGPDESRLFTYAPIDAGARPAALELSKSLESERAFEELAIAHLAATAVVMIALAALVAGAFSTLFVGRPVRALVEQARRVARGDLSQRLHLAQRDELGHLAEELNAMCDHLAAARERIAAETEARIRALEQLRHADRLMTVGRLAAGIAHEIGTPLHVISLRAEMAETGEIQGEGAARNARVIKEQSQRITSIIRQLLDFARPRRPEKIDGDLFSLAERAARLLGPLATKRGVCIVLEDRKDGACRAEFDAVQMEQVLANLIMNAVQAMPGGGTVTIRASATNGGDSPDGRSEAAHYAAVSVDDTGPGISAADLPRLFDPFFTTKDVGEGTGLGLSVAYGIVHEHGGRIEVESAEGRGSSFRVLLPASGGHGP